MRIDVAVLSTVGHTSIMIDAADIAVPRSLLFMLLLNVALLLLGLVQMTVRLRSVKHDHMIPGYLQTAKLNSTDSKLQGTLSKAWA